MLILSKASIANLKLLDEATIGRFEFGDIVGSVPGVAGPRLDKGYPDRSTDIAKISKTRGLTAQTAILKIEGEILVSEEELKQYEEQFGIYTPELPVAVPFQSWKDLINAVKERTPQAKKLIRYLEDYGYQDILKMQRAVMSKVGDKEIKQIRWDNFLLPTDVAQAAGYKHGADYNKQMYKKLLEFAPRTKKPEVYGGKKLMRGTIGSKREMKKRVEPMVDQIVAEHKAETLHNLRNLFSVLPEKWVDAFLGTNEQNVSYSKDDKAIHLGRTVEVIPSNRDYLEISRLNRVLALLRNRAKSEPEAYDEAIEQVENQIKEKTSQVSGKFDTIYTEIYVSLSGFAVALTEELKQTEPLLSEPPSIKFKTSLTNLPELISLLDPPGGNVRTAAASGAVSGGPQISWGKHKAAPRGVTTTFEFRKDLYEFIGEIVSQAVGIPLIIDMFNRNGTIDATTSQHMPPRESDMEEYENGEEPEANLEEAVRQIRGSV